MMMHSGEIHYDNVVDQGRWVLSRYFCLLIPHTFLSVKDLIRKKVRLHVTDGEVDHVQEHKSPFTLDTLKLDERKWEPLSVKRISRPIEFGEQPYADDIPGHMFTVRTLFSNEERFLAVIEPMISRILEIHGPCRFYCSPPQTQGSRFDCNLSRFIVTAFREGELVSVLSSLYTGAFMSSIAAQARSLTRPVNLTDDIGELIAC